MNYRHAFHAGNFADVLKHAVLALVLEHMTQKAKPLRVIDSHAGVGRYRLDADEAVRTGEWRQGIGRLLLDGAETLPDAIAPLLEPYLAAVRACNAGPEPTVYPGSPEIALALMRPEDRLIACELHPEDAASLRRHLAGDRRAKALELDGWQALRALLPPKERRGLVLIDPPFEETGELQRLVQGLADGLRRFSTGTYVLWFPIKDRRTARELAVALGELPIAPDKLLWLELWTDRIETAERLAGTGLVIANPPFRLEEQAGQLLPFLSERLATGSGHGWHVRRLSAAHPG